MIQRTPYYGSLQAVVVQIRAVAEVRNRGLEARKLRKDENSPSVKNHVAVAYRLIQLNFIQVTMGGKGGGSFDWLCFDMYGYEMELTETSWKSQTHYSTMEAMEGQHVGNNSSGGNRHEAGNTPQTKVGAGERSNDEDSSISGGRRSSHS